MNEYLPFDPDFSEPEQRTYEGISETAEQMRRYGFDEMDQRKFCVFLLPGDMHYVRQFSGKTMLWEDRMLGALFEMMFPGVSSDDTADTDGFEKDLAGLVKMWSDCNYRFFHPLVRRDYSASAARLDEDDRRFIAQHKMREC